MHGGLESREVDAVPVTRSKIGRHRYVRRAPLALKRRRLSPWQHDASGNNKWSCSARVFRLEAIGEGSPTGLHRAKYLNVFAKTSCSAWFQFHS
jgi:hypothetical protein